MSMRMPDLSANLVLHSGQFNDAIKETGKLAFDVIDDIIAKVDGLDRILDVVANTIIGFGAGLVASTAPGIVNAQRFEAAMARVFALIDPTAAEMRQLNDEVLRLGTNIRGPVELADALVDLASAGFTVDQQLAILPETIRLSTASLISMDAASELLIQTMAAFNIQAADVARITNVIAAANAISTADALRLAEAYSMVGANAASQNLTLEETTAALSILIDVFQSGEMAGTSFRNVITRLAAGTSELRAAASKANIPIRELNPSIVGVNTAVLRLRDLLASGASAWAIFGDRGQTAANILAQNADRFAEVEAAITGTEALLRQFQIQTRTTQNALTSLRNTALVTGISFSQGFKPFIDAATSGLKVLLEIANAIPQPIKSLLGVTTAIAGSTLVWHGVLLKLFTMYMRLPEPAKQANLVFKILNSVVKVLGIDLTKVNTILKALTWQNIQAAIAGNAFAASLLAQARAAGANMAAMLAQTLILKPLTLMWTILSRVLTLLVKVPLLSWLLIGVFAMREMAKHTNILRPAMEFLRSAFESSGEKATMFGVALKQVVGFLKSFAIAAMQALALIVARVAKEINLAMLSLSNFAQLLDPANWNLEGWRRIQQEQADGVAAINAEYDALIDNINALGLEATLNAFGVYTDAQAELAAKLGISTEELERQRLALIEFREEAGRSADQIIFDIDATPLERTLRGIDDSVKGLLDELDVYLDDNPLIGLVDWDGNEVEDVADSMYADIIRMYETAAQTAKDIAVGDFVADLQRQLDEAQIKAMGEGRQRLAAENEQRIAQLEDARERALRALIEGSEDYIKVSEIYDGLILASREEYANGLRKLEDEIVKDVEDFERRVVQARINGMDDGEAQIRARTALSIANIRREVATRLATMEEGTEEYERLLQAERELIALEYAAQDREIAKFNSELAKRMRERERAYRDNLAALEAQIRNLAAAAQDDPLIALLHQQQEALAANAQTYAGYLDEITKDVEDGLITTEVAERRRLELLTTYGEAQTAQLEANVRDQQRLLAEREAAEISFSQRIEEIRTATRLATIDDPVDRARQQQRAELAALDAWYREQVVLAQDNAQTLARIETEYQAERLRRVTQGNIAIADALEDAREQRINAETNAAQRLANEGIAGVISQDTLAAALDRLVTLRQEMIAAGAASEELVALGEAIAGISQSISDLSTASFDSFVTELDTLKAGVAELEDELLTPAEREAAQTRRLFATWDEQLAAFARNQRAKAESAEEAELRIAAMAEWVERRKLAHTEVIERARAEAAAARVARVRDFEQTLVNERTDLLIAGIRDEQDLAQAAYEEEARRRQVAFAKELDDLEANHTERLRLLTAFNAREALLAAQHQENLARIQSTAVQNSLQDFVRQNQRVQAALANAAQSAAESAITAGVEGEIRDNEARVEVTERLIAAYKEEKQALEERNTELLESLNLVPTLREYMETVEELFGQDLVFMGDIADPLRSLEAQRELAEDLYRQAVQANLPLQQRMQLLRELVDLNEQVVEAGGASLRSDRSLVDASRREYVDAAAAARTVADEYADNVTRLAELETATKASTAALEALGEVINGLNTDLETLRQRTGGQMFNEVTGEFEDLEVAAEAAAQTYRDAVAVALSGEGFPSNKPTWLDGMIRGLEIGGRELEDAVYTMSYAGGRVMPTGILQGFLDSPAPFTDEGQTVAEHLGLDNSYDAAQEIGRNVAQRLGMGFEEAAEEQAPQQGADAWNQAAQEAIVDGLAPIEAQVTAMGLTAGMGLMQAFANGILTNRQILMNAVEEVLQDVRDRLPSSDAKRGPLSDLTRSGRMLVRTFAGGAAGNRSWLARSIERTFSAARPGLHAGALRTHGLTGAQYGGQSYAGPLIGELNVDGRPTSPIAGALSMSARGLAEQALREAGVQLRMRGTR